MSDRDDITRRSIIRAGAAGALGAAGLTGQAAGLTDVTDTLDSTTDVSIVERIPLLDVDDQVQTVAPTAFPERATGIRPGSQILVERDGTVGGCSANFVWEDGDGTKYLGAAGHCFLGDAPASSEYAQGEGDDVTDVTVTVCIDCTFGGLTGMNVVQGEGVELGDVVYARQEELGGGEGVGHDFGLVEIPAEAEHLVDPSLPQFGGPTGTVDGVVPAGDPVVQYGAGVVNGETYLTQGSRGLSLGAGPSEGSWIAGIRATPGDSGSALSAATDLTSYEGGPSAGVLTHITTNGTAGTTIDRCKDMVSEDGFSDNLQVVLP
ncbi:hypothetical protein HWV07_07525 [Natronomonas salina]|uniref:hypothetical protein n=1 Tax=Natronomonas salina TaxID=1710540 RepID=UPI0015B67656|nr:hypothetical protein [Natronomonas salina]QLD88887.1 hypothetical protein HWV07_07525 [Natronomonas salina]